MEHQPRPYQLPRVEKAPQPKTPELAPVQTPQAFLAGVRRSILGENPDAQRITAFEQSMAGRAFGVAEKYFQLQESEQKYPFIRQRYVGMSNTSSLGDEIGDRYVAVNVGGQYRLSVNENGIIDLNPPMRGGDDSLIYHTTDRAGFGVKVDGKTGAVTVGGAGETQVAPETQARLYVMLDTTNAYYETFQRSLPLAENFRLAMGIVPDGLFPRFPKEEIQRLRLGRT